MSNETKAKKESKLDIDNNFDLQLVRTLSPALRWILVLPIAFLAMFVIQIGYGFIVKLILSNFAQDGIVSIIGNSTVMLAKYTMFVIAATSTAPVGSSCMQQEVHCSYRISTYRCIAMCGRYSHCHFSCCFNR